MAVTPIKNIILVPPKAPNLPIAPVEYAQTYQDQVLNALRLYFNQLDNFAQGSNLPLYGTTANRPIGTIQVPLGVGLTYFDTTLGIPIWWNGTAWENALNSSGALLRNPHGAFSSDADQTTTANTATLMTLNTTDFANGVSIASSKITVANAGIYNLQFSVQLENNDNAPQDVFIWLKQDGVDIAGSTGKVGIPARKSPGDPFHGIYGWNYFCSMTAGQYIEIYWSTTNSTVTIQAYPASVSPVKPSTQSVVATLSFVSALN